MSRRSNTRRAVAASTCLALMIFLAACGGGNDGGAGARSGKVDLVIGNLLPLSGQSKALGESGRKASDLAIDQIKAAISETGADHDVRTVEQDQGKDPDAAIEAAKTVVGGERATCLTGPWTADALVQVATEVTIPDKVLEISPASATDDVSELSDHDLVDTTALPVSLEGSALSEAIRQELGPAQSETVNLAASNDTYATTLSQDFLLAWQDKDGTVGTQVALSPPPPSGSGSTSGGYGSSGYSGSSSYSSIYSSQVQQLTSGSPDAVLVIDDLDGFTQLASALSSSYGWDPSMAWGSDRLVSPGLPGLVGSEVVDGMRALTPGIPKREEPSSAFVENFKAADPHDVKLAPLAAQEFDATMLCYLAAVAAGSTDGQEMADELIDITAPGGEEFTWQQLPEAIKALEEGEDIDYTGASGPIDMDVRGDPTRGVFDVYRYRNGRLEVVSEVSAEKPNPATP